MSVRSSRTFDKLLLLKDAGAVTATGVAQIGGQAAAVDFGQANTGPVMAVIDTSALVGTGTYTVTIQGSTDAAFTAPVDLASATLTAVGRNELPFSTFQGSTIYRYIRARFVVGGTTPSVNSTIYVARG